MFEMIVSAPMLIRSGKVFPARSSSQSGRPGAKALTTRTPASTPRKPQAAAALVWAHSRKESVGLLVVDSAGKAGPGLVAAMTKSTSPDRKSVVEGKSGAERGDPGGRRIITKKNT